MPNHIQNKLVITGDADNIRRLIDTISTPNEDEGTTHYIDFEKIIPMPEILNTTHEGSQKTWGLAYYSIKENKPEIIQKFCHYLTNIEEKLAKHSEEELAELYECGKTAYEVYEKYGATSWYDWRIQNWGTKWNAYSTYVMETAYTTEYVIFFQTAWNGVEPIIEKLVSMFPELDFDYKYAEEDFSYNTGQGCSNGEGSLSMAYPNGGSDEAVALYIECWEADENDYYKNDKGEWRCKDWDDEEDEENEE
jgi:hypothetical protein